MHVRQTQARNKMNWLPFLIHYFMNFNRGNIEEYMTWPAKSLLVNNMEFIKLIKEIQSEISLPKSLEPYPAKIKYTKT